jgi:hypothetical protein
MNMKCGQEKSHPYGVLAACSTRSSVGHAVHVVQCWSCRHAVTAMFGAVVHTNQPAHCDIFFN